ncbi:MAG: hypothetical protein QW478_09300 [Candidatus Micrarchaeaceae archaeon]
MNKEYVLSELQIEEMERDVLIKLGFLFKESLDEFSTSVDRSLGYLDRIILPIIMASKQDKSYNPFADIIEKYTIHILTHKLEKEGYHILPLGYAADITLENKNHILSIDIKTANLDNPSDFKNTIPLGINQITHVAKLRINNKFLPEPYYVYPTIPPYYKLPSGENKLVLTFGLLFIYPSYRDLIEEIRVDYVKLYNFFIEKVAIALVPIIKQEIGCDDLSALRILNSKPLKSTYKRKELIAENLIRGIFLHEHQRNEILNSLNSVESKEIIEAFSNKLKNFTDKLRDRNIKPIAIIAISIPNGLLVDKYKDRFVSGKNYSKSARYHYEDGVFEYIKENMQKSISRVLFLDLDKNYLEEIKNYFSKIVLLDYEFKVL